MPHIKKSIFYRIIGFAASAVGVALAYAQALVTGQGARVSGGGFEFKWSTPADFRRRSREPPEGIRHIRG